jgi:copper(I)-binding protein
VVFASGGNHLMLFGVQLTDTPAILEIELDNGESIAAPFQQTRLN